MLVATFAVGVVLVLWPLVGSVTRQQWGYVLGIVLLGPLGGLVWLLVGRREHASVPGPAEKHDPWVA